MIGLFARHPTAANLLVLLLVALGLRASFELRRETFPDFTPSKLQIQAVYPGATAEEVEAVICERVEEALDGVRFVSEIVSEAREGVGIVTVEMDEAGDFSLFNDDVRVEVDGIDDFPDAVEEPVVTQLGTTDRVLTLLVYGPMAATDLKAYCEDLKSRLQRLPGVSLINLKGFSDRQLHVQLSLDALRAAKLSAQEVADLVARQSVDLPAGILETRDGDMLLRFTEERRSPAELEQLVLIANKGGAELRLGHLGRVVDRFELAEDKVEVAGQRAGLLVIEKNKTQDTIRVADAVKEFVAEERLRRPRVSLEITRDASTLVKGRLELLLRNGWQGLLLVVLTLWLFFNFRLSFWVAASVPVSLLGAFIFLPAMGLTINMMTMVGLLLALGLLMDDGIVIAENVATHRARGKPPMQAAIDGVKEVWAGVFSSFLTTVCVLGPLMFIEGDIGKVLKVIPMILILVMAVSLVEAFLILPAHLGHSLHDYDPGAAGGFRARFEAAIEWARSRLGALVDRLLAWRYAFLGCVVGTLLASVGLVLGGVVKFQAFPDLDGDVVMARLLLPQGTRLERTERLVGQLTDGLTRVNARFKPQQPGQADLVRTVVVQFNENADAFEKGPHVATVTADLLSAEEREARVDDVLAAWREEVGRLPDTLALTYTEPTFGPAGRPIEIRFMGSDLAQLKAAVQEAKAYLAEIVGVTNLSDDLRPGKPEVRLRLREGALGLGLTAQSAAGQVRAAFQGVTANEIQSQGESYEVDLALEPAAQLFRADLDRLALSLPNGTQLPAATVLEAETGRGWARIARVNGRRAVSLRGDVDPALANTNDVLAALQRDVLSELETSYQDLEITLEGEVKEGGTTQASMAAALLSGLLGVFILLSFQFRSYIEPLIVLAAIPLALVGVIWGHLLLGLDLSMPSMLGFASLAGIVVNDSILLVLFLKAARSEGADVVASAGQASRLRFRAIVLTSATTIAGLTPLLFEQSMQAQVLIPLAVSISSGMLASTVLVLLVIPCLYAVLGDLDLISDVEDIDDAHGHGVTPPAPSEPGEASEPEPEPDPEPDPESL